MPQGRFRVEGSGQKGPQKDNIVLPLDIYISYKDRGVRVCHAYPTFPKPRIIHESPTEPVTGLGFREPTEDHPNVHLFIVTTNRVLCYQASGKGSGGAPTVVDEIGAGLGCATMDWKARAVVVARDEAIYLCGTESRGPCYAYEGE